MVAAAEELQEEWVQPPQPEWDSNADAAHIHNVSQSEFSFKHRLFFEENYRTELGRRRRQGEPVKSIKRQRFHSFQAIDENSWSGSSEEVTQRFTYAVNIPDKSNSIISVDHAELHFIIRPTECKADQQVTIRLLKETKKVHVDACSPRWESLSIHPLPLQLKSFNITCDDCKKKGVAFSSPYLNIVTSEVRKTRYPRRVTKKERKRCRLSPLHIDLDELPAFKDIASPRKFDIGRCRGACLPHDLVNAQHTFFRYELSKGGKGPMPCCTTAEYRNLEYLKPVDTKLRRFTWDNAIAVKCHCQ